MRSPQRANLTADGVHVKMWVDLGTHTEELWFLSMKKGIVFFLLRWFKLPIHPVPTTFFFMNLFYLFI